MQKMKTITKVSGFLTFFFKFPPFSFWIIFLKNLPQISIICQFLLMSWELSVLCVNVNLHYSLCNSPQAQMKCTLHHYAKHAHKNLSTKTAPSSKSECTPVPKLSQIMSKQTSEQWSAASLILSLSVKCRNTGNSIVCKEVIKVNFFHFLRHFSICKGSFSHPNFRLFISSQKTNLPKRHEEIQFLHTMKKFWTFLY